MNLTPGAGGSGGLGGNQGSPGSAGSVDVSGGTLTLNAGLIMASSTTPSADPINLVAATLNASGGAVDATAAMSLVDGGTINLSAGTMTATALDTADGNFNFTGGVLGVDTFVGDLTQDGGTLAPGASPGLTSVTGNYTFNAGSFAVELAGSGGVAGTDFDQLLVTSTATLGGDLTIDLLGGFIPFAADSFTVLSAGDLSGSFGNVANGARLNTLGGMGSLLVSYDGTSNAVVLSNYLTDLPGDYNNDGAVNAADYTTWRDNLGAPAGTLPNDGDDGVIGPAQYATWKANFGTSVPSAASLDSAAVPEPASVVLLVLFGAIGIGFVVRRC